jgi:hypothetical protein
LLQKKVLMSTHSTLFLQEKCESEKGNQIVNCVAILPFIKIFKRFTLSKSNFQVVNDLEIHVEEYNPVKNELLSMI